MYAKRDEFCKFCAMEEWLMAMVLVVPIKYLLNVFVCFVIIGCLNIQSNPQRNSYDLISILMTYPILRVPYTQPHSHTKDQ